MNGTNRALLSELQRSLRRAINNAASCVFVSYRRADQKLAVALAEFITKQGVDVWIDLQSGEVQQAKLVGDEVALAKAIETGLNGSTHLIGIISPETWSSPWVPYEIGSARGRSRPIAHVIHDQLKPEQIPAFVTLGVPLGDRADLSRWIGSLRPMLLEMRAPIDLPPVLDVALPVRRTRPL